MKLFFSGGGAPWLPEMQMPHPDVMLSFYMCSCAANMKKGQTKIKKYKPDTRIKRLLKANKRRLAKKGKK